jgi:hypothetical protein
MVYILDI